MGYFSGMLVRLTCTKNPDLLVTYASDGCVIAIDSNKYEFVTNAPDQMNTNLKMPGPIPQK